jgi:3-hydroxy-9,10-secoandrosta-1,3,5(10)-triene-9,17-dione monooxygenase reductase component
VSAVGSRQISGADFRQVMAHVPTSVSVVAAMSPDGPVGLTVGTFVSVSLDPPLVGFFPALSSTSWPAVEAAGRFAVSVLGDHAETTCRQLARSGPDKFAGVGWQLSPLGSPVLTDAVAWFDCELERRHDAGDHHFVLGLVHELGLREGNGPLVFCHGTYKGLDTQGRGAPDFTTTPEV